MIRAVRVITNGKFKKGDRVDYNFNSGYIKECYYHSCNNIGYESYDIMTDKGKIVKTGNSSLYEEIVKERK